DDVLEVGADDRIVEPAIIERGGSADEDKPKKKKRQIQVTEIDPVVPGPAVAETVAASPDDVVPLKPKCSRFPQGTEAPELAGAPANDQKPAAEVVDDAVIESSGPVPPGGPVIVEPRFKHAD